MISFIDNSVSEGVYMLPTSEGYSHYIKET